MKGSYFSKIIDFFLAKFSKRKKETSIFQEVYLDCDQFSVVFNIYKRPSNGYSIAFKKSSQ